MSAPSQTVLNLRKIHHKHAAKVARQAKILHWAAKSLLRTQKQIEKEAVAAAGKDYKLDHSVGFDEHGPLDEQTERGDLPTGPGLVDIVDTARAIEMYASRVSPLRTARCRFRRGDCFQSKQTVVH